MALPNVSLRELEFFRETVRAGSATRAAERLSVSQPAVSRALARLEDRFGVALFTREDGRLTPTAAALALIEELEPVYSTLEKISQFSTRSPKPETEILRIAAPPTFSICLVEPLIARFMEDHPSARFQLQMCSSQEVIQKIAMDDADFGISDTNLTHEGIRFDTVLEMDAVCILRDDDPLADKNLITAQDLDKRRLITMSRSFSSRFALERIFEKANIAPEIVAEVTTSYSACSFISQGMGIGVLSPFPVLDGPFENLVVRRFAPVVGYRTRLLTPVAARPSWLAQSFSAFIISQSSIRLTRLLEHYELNPTLTNESTP